MQRSVFVEGNAIGRGLRSFVQELVDRARRIGVQHEDLPEMRARVAQEFQPVFFWTRERLFVTMDYPLRVRGHFTEPDKTLAHEFFVAIRNFEFLKVRVEAWL